jgi:predicted alpha/beta superfamily hydrolase
MPFRRPSPSIRSSAAIAVAALCAVFCGAGSARAQQTIPLADRLEVPSKALGEMRAILVSTPRAYNPARAYPVLYLTDGDTQLFHTAATIDFLSRNGRMPQMIVVGIGNTDRTRDLTPTRAAFQTEDGRTLDLPTAGGSATFLRFIRTELAPFIEQRYKTEPFRVLAGHSFGGLFALMAFADDPAFFNAYVAVGPTLTWDNDLPIRRVRERLASLGDLHRTLVATRGGEEPEIAKALADLGTVIGGGKTAGLLGFTQVFEGEDHGSAVMKSHYFAFEKIFDGWRPALDKQTRTYPDGLRGVEAHYKALSMRLGWTVAPPEAVINALGYAELARNHMPAALEYLQWNVDRYPGSANVHDSLGEALEQAGQLLPAVAAYEKAIALAETTKDPNLEIFRQHRVRAQKALKKS